AWNGRSIFPSVPDLVLESDASLTGWGARCGGDIDWRYMVRRGVQIAHKLFRASCRLLCDQKLYKKQSSMFYPASHGQHCGSTVYQSPRGTRSRPLALLAKSLWEFCLAHKFSLIAEYLPGSLNSTADWHSRHLFDSSDWMLHRSVFRYLERKWGPFQIDLFASRLNARLPRFFSWRPDPLALATDAFLQDWSQLCFSTFYPYQQSSKSSPTATGVLGSPGSLLAITDLVSPSSRTCGRLSNSSSELSIPSPGPTRVSPQSNPRQFSNSVSMVRFRSSQQSLPISSEATEFINNAWAPGTRRAYESAWSLWSSWCVGQCANPFSA
ncbi:hypothetical protein NDU88_000077, partial [Pleurodeles waltl]